jgi:hypothetical protein
LLVGVAAALRAPLDHPPKTWTALPDANNNNTRRWDRTYRSYSILQPMSSSYRR